MRGDYIDRPPAELPARLGPSAGYIPAPTDGPGAPARAQARPAESRSDAPAESRVQPRPPAPGDVRPPERAESPPALNGYRVSVRGRGLEKLLMRLEERGVHPRGVRRRSRRRADMLIGARELKALDALCAELGVEVAERRAQGVTRALRHLKRRAALPICAALCALMIGVLSTRIWLVRVDAPQELAPAIGQALYELGARPGAAKSALDLGAIEDALMADVAEVKFCQARVRGVTLTLSAQQAAPSPNLPSDAPPGSLYARCDAVVERVQALAGTALVRRGDTVRAGDVLIEGLERVSADESAPVKAIGVVTGRVWYEGLGECALSQLELERTGRSSTRRTIRLFGLEWELSSEAGFSLCDREVSFQPLGGMFVPLGVATERCFELRQRRVERPLEDAKAQALELARQNALKKCPDNATVIDKWAEYSIIEGNTIQARYVVEAEVTIQFGG